MKNHILLFFFFCSITNSVSCQTVFTEADKNYYIFQDSLLMDENKDVYNGLEYIDDHKSFTKEDHKFYKSYDFSSGFVMYNSQPYFNIKMNYDLLNDLLVIEFANSSLKKIRLNSTLVSEFKINNDRFVRLPEVQELEAFYGNGFFKNAMEGNHYSIFVKCIKKKVEKIRNYKIYYTFKDNRIYIVRYKDDFFRIDGIKDAIDAFPFMERQIKVFYKTNRKLYKMNRGQFLERLFRSLDNLDDNI